MKELFVIRCYEFKLTLLYSAPIEELRLTSQGLSTIESTIVYRINSDSLHTQKGAD